MNGSRWKQITKLFSGALEVDKTRRQAWLEKACAGDRVLLKEVNDLLRAYTDSELPEQPVEELRQLAFEEFGKKRMENRQVGPFLVKEFIGAGGMGEVWLARDTRLQRDIAIKFPPPAWAHSDLAKNRFLREARAAASLDHPNICTIYEADETTDGILYIAMACYDGETLQHRLEKNGPLPADETLDFAIQTARGLGSAHNQNLVHRDIKPANLMLTPDRTVKILDFGIAKAIGTGLTTGHRPGTAAYMAPEQARGEHVDNRTDLWSLGVVMYELLTGQPPFQGENETAVVHSIIHDEAKPVTEHRSDIPSELHIIIARCLEKDASERFQHAEDLISALQALQKALQADNYPASQDAASTIRHNKHQKVKNGIAGNLTIHQLTGKAAVYLTLAALIIIAGIVFFQHTNHLLPTASVPELSDRVLVVPFENRTGDSSLDPIGRTASDWITEGLLQSGVTDAVQTMTTLQLIAEEELVGGGLEDRLRLVDLAGRTNASVLVSGRFIRIGSDIVFETEIIDAHDSNVIASLDRLRGPINEPMKVINDLQQKILSVLSIHVYPGFDLEFFANPPDYESYTHYMEGLKYFHRDFDKSVEHFRQALEVDPDFMQAILFKGWSYLMTRQYAEADSQFRHVDAERDRLSPYNEYYLDFSLHRMEGDRQASTATALQWQNLAPRNQLANYLLGSHALSINRPQITIDTYSGFEMEDRFIADAPGGLLWFSTFSRAYHRLGKYEKQLETARMGMDFFPEDLVFRYREVEALAAMGKIKQLEDVILKSKTIDEPSRGSYGNLLLTAAFELRAHGFKNESMETAVRAVAWFEINEPENEIALASAFYNARQWEEAYAIYEKLISEDPENVGYKGALGVLAAMKENEEEALQVEKSLRNVNASYLYGNHTYYRARINAILGNKNKAVSLIKKSFEQGRSFGIGVHRDLAFESLYDYPPFRKLLEPDRQGTDMFTDFVL